MLERLVCLDGKDVVASEVRGRSGGRLAAFGEDIVVVGDLADLCDRLHGEELLLEEACLPRRNGGVDNELLAHVRERYLDGEVAAVLVLAADADGVHAGVELLHRGEEFLEALFLVIVHFRKRDLEELRVERAIEFCGFLEARDGAGGLEVLHQEAMKIVIHMRILHALDDAESILDALAEEDAEQLFHDGVVRLGSEAEHYLFLFLLRELLRRMEHVLYCSLLVGAHCLVGDGLARGLYPRFLERALLFHDLGAKERNFLLRRTKLRQRSGFE